MSFDSLGIYGSGNERILVDENDRVIIGYKL